MKKSGLAIFCEEGVMTRKVSTNLCAVLFIAISFCFICDSAFGVIANPKPFRLQQPDGTEIQLRVRGDEKHSWLEDDKGYLVKKEPNGRFMYAKIVNGAKVSTAWQVGKVDPAAKGLIKGVRPKRLRKGMFDEVPLLKKPLRRSGTAGRMALPKSVKHWSLCTLRDKLIKIGAKVVSHSRYVIFQMAEVAVSQRLFREIPVNRKLKGII